MYEGRKQGGRKYDGAYLDSDISRPGIWSSTFHWPKVIIRSIKNPIRVLSKDSVLQQDS